MNFPVQQESESTQEILMDNSPTFSDWPTFKGRRLTDREMKSGKIITQVGDLLNDPYDPNGISRDQLWMDRGKSTLS